MITDFTNPTQKDENGYTPLHHAAENGHLDQVPPELLTWENLSVPGGKNNDTPLELAALFGNLGQLPANLINRENLSRLGTSKYRFLYRAIFSDFKGIPEECLDREALACISPSGNGNLLVLIQAISRFGVLPTSSLRSCRDVQVGQKKLIEHLSAAAFSRVRWTDMTLAHSGQAPAEWVTADELKQRYERGHTLLHWAAYLGQLGDIPAGMMTRELLEVPDDKGMAVLHAAAVGRCLNVIPQELVTSRLLLQRDRDQRTVFHHAAKHGCLDHIPQGLLTRENLVARDEYESTVFHVAAWSGSLGQLPPFLLNAENLTLPNRDKNTPLHYSAGQLDRVPPEMLTLQNLLLENTWGHSVIHKAAVRTCADGKGHLIPEGFKDIPIPVLFTCKEVLLEGKTVLDHLAPEQRVKVMAYAESVVASIAR